VLHTIESETTACVAAHGLVELYAILTTLPVTPRITAEQAQKLIRQSIMAHMDVVVLDEPDYQAVIEKVTTLGLRGGVVYDALHLQAAEKTGADRLVTFNRRDFGRLAAGTMVELVFL
jgi:predicted nucleic acid-binding protein